MRSGVAERCAKPAKADCSQFAEQPGHVAEMMGWRGMGHARFTRRRAVTEKSSHGSTWIFTDFVLIRGNPHESVVKNLHLLANSAISAVKVFHNL